MCCCLHLKSVLDGLWHMCPISWLCVYCSLLFLSDMMIAAHAAAKVADMMIAIIMRMVGCVIQSLLMIHNVSSIIRMGNMTSVGIFCDNAKCILFPVAIMNMSKYMKVYVYTVILSGICDNNVPWFPSDIILHFAFLTVWCDFGGKNASINGFEKYMIVHTDNNPAAYINPLISKLRMVWNMK